MILIVDDNAGVRDALELLFDINDLQAKSVENAEQALDAVRAGGVDLIVQDMNFGEDTTSGQEGVALFKKLREIDAEMPIILLTAWTHLDQAVDLVRDGAADYLAKPWDDDRLVVSVRNLLELRRERNKNRERTLALREARESLAEDYQLCGVVYASSAMFDVLQLATRVSRADVPVLITGPNGAGKQKIAEIIQANSSVKDGPFVTVDVGALSTDLIEAELFGAEAGAFTGATKARAGRFEAADGGTLFLDEIGNLTAQGQQKLLRVLESGEFERLGSNQSRKVKVRVISATNIDLEQAVAKGEFREDLLYRLNVISLHLPPLADRRADILPLAQHFADGHSIAASAEQALVGEAWPGNVRQLSNTMERGKILAGDQPITIEDLQLRKGEGMPQDPGAEELQTALDDAEGVVAQAARTVGLSRQAFYRRLKKHGIEITGCIALLLEFIL